MGGVERLRDKAGRGLIGEVATFLSAPPPRLLYRSKGHSKKYDFSPCPLAWPASFLPHLKPTTRFAVNPAILTPSVICSRR
jgi:hypothetical protein